jgi:predicted transcriptional regulator
MLHMIMKNEVVTLVVMDSRNTDKNSTNKEEKRFYRSRTEIIADILNAVTDNEPRGLGKTKIMFITQLSFEQLTDYLQDLTVVNELLILKEPKKVDSSNRSFKGTYHITEKGSEYLALYNLMNAEAVGGLRRKKK